MSLKACYPQEELKGSCTFSRRVKILPLMETIEHAVISVRTWMKKWTDVLS